MSGDVFDLPAAPTDEGEGDPASPGEGSPPEGRREGPEVQATGDERPSPGRSPEDRMAELERRDRERDQQLTQVVAQNIALRQRLEEAGQKPSEASPKRTPEELQEWIQKGEGDPFSASKVLIDQEVGEVEDRILTKLDAREKRDRLIRDFTSSLPELVDPNSKTSREALLLRDQKYARGIGRNEDEAYVAALVEIAARNGGMRRTPPRTPTGETVEEHAARRRLEAAQPAGAGAGAPPSTEAQLTDAELGLARRMGLKGVFDDDPKVRARERQSLKEELEYEKSRSARGEGGY